MSTQLEISRQYLFRDLICKPLVCFTEAATDISILESTSTENIVVNENSLQLCVEDLHKIFCMGPQVFYTMFVSMLYKMLFKK